MPKRLRCELLCEDLAQERFFRPILERFGRVQVTRGRPSGGFTFVLAQAVKSATYVYRYRQEAVALLVAIDGDAFGLKARRDLILAKLTEAGIDPSMITERLAICVPTRNVETWELWLQGRRDLDEQTDYKREVETGGDSRRSDEFWFASLSPAEATNEATRLPSLAHGRKEIERLKLTAKS